MGECGCAVASLWLGHAPSIGLAIGPRQMGDLLSIHVHMVSVIGRIV